MNILVTGANGQLGRALRLLAQGYVDCNFTFTDIAEADGLETVKLDITNKLDIEAALDKYATDVIINCAAYTNVDKAESDSELCFKLNAEAPALLAEAIKERGGALVQISTDYVFGGEPNNTPCSEEQKGTPIGEYGRSKLAGEEKIKATGCNYAIIRTSWLYSKWGKNFLRTMLALTETKPEINVVFDQVGTPTYACDLAQAIMLLLKKANDMGEWRSETYNFSNEGVCSWFDFAKSIAELSGHSKCNVKPCHSSEFPSPVHRPAYSVLDKTKIKAALGIEIPYWRDSLRMCMENMGELACQSL